MNYNKTYYKLKDLQITFRVPFYNIQFTILITIINYKIWQLQVTIVQLLFKKLHAHITIVQLIFKKLLIRYV